MALLLSLGFRLILSALCFFTMGWKAATISAGRAAVNQDF
jgi:hypothetical protein